MPAAKSPQESILAAQGIVKTINLFAVMRFGPEAAIDETELAFIEEPLARIVEKYGPIADRYSALLDPLMLGIGLVMYGKRLVDLETEPAKPVKQPMATPKPSIPETPVNGQGIDEDATAVPTVEPEIAALFGNGLR